MKFCTDIYFYGSLCLKISCNLDKHGVKSFRIRRFYGPCFPAFGLCGELLGISPYSVQMRETATRKTTNTGTFYAVRTLLQFYLHVYMTMLLILLNLAALYGHH